MDLSEQKKKHPEKERKLERMEKTSRTAELFADLKGHGAVKIILDGLESRIEGINSVLMNKLDLPERDRRDMLIERQCWMDMIAIYTHQEQVMENVKKFINKL